MLSRRVTRKRANQNEIREKAPFVPVLKHADEFSLKQPCLIPPGHVALADLVLEDIKKWENDPQYEPMVLNTLNGNDGNYFSGQMQRWSLEKLQDMLPQFSVNGFTMNIRNQHLSKESGVAFATFADNTGQLHIDDTNGVIILAKGKLKEFWIRWRRDGLKEDKSRTEGKFFHANPFDMADKFEEDNEGSSREEMEKLGWTLVTLTEGWSFYLPSGLLHCVRSHGETVGFSVKVSCPAPPDRHSQLFVGTQKLLATVMPELPKGDTKSLAKKSSTTMIRDAKKTLVANKNNAAASMAGVASISGVGESPKKKNGAKKSVSKKTASSKAAGKRSAPNEASPETAGEEEEDVQTYLMPPPPPPAAADESKKEPESEADDNDVSHYERLRLERIERNEARPVALGAKRPRKRAKLQKRNGTPTTGAPTTSTGSPSAPPKKTPTRPPTTASPATLVPTLATGEPRASPATAAHATGTPTAGADAKRPRKTGKPGENGMDQNCGGLKRSEKNWLRNYRHLKNFKELHGDCWVTRANDPSTQKHKLYNWVKAQRKNGLKKTSESRIELLNALGFDWNGKDPYKQSLDDNWKAKLQKLSGADPSVMEWKRTQQATHNRGGLRKERVDMLLEIERLKEPKDSIRPKKKAKKKRKSSRGMSAQPADLTVAAEDVSVGDDESFEESDDGGCEPSAAPSIGDDDAFEESDDGGGKPSATPRVNSSITTKGSRPTSQRKRAKTSRVVTRRKADKQAETIEYLLKEAKKSKKKEKARRRRDKKQATLMKELLASQITGRSVDVTAAMQAVQALGDASSSDDSSSSDDETVSSIGTDDSGPTIPHKQKKRKKMKR